MIAARTPCVLFSFCLVFACAVGQGAEPSDAGEPPAKAADAARSPEQADLVMANLGEPVYRSYCASCHGIDARGDGPTASALQTPPANLRRIAARRGGTFPDAEIARKIDGRFEIDAHGSREMPVWGEVFTSDIPDAGTAESIARGRLAVLVEYLKSIQETGTPADPGATRETMDEIFEAMRVLLPLSLAGDRFEDPANEVRVRRALAVLDANASHLEQHGMSTDVGFAHLARSLAIDARDVRLRYAAGHRQEARYLVQTLAETCVACHSRVPGASVPLSDAFVRDIAEMELPLDQRAKLAYATRQFDVAMDLYESLLASPSTSATDIDLGGHLDDYLELSIRVIREHERPAIALEAFSKRDDLAPVLREEVAAWIASLRELAAKPPSAQPIAEARRLVGDGGEHPLQTERDALVDHLEASGLLNRALDRGLLEREERAEAYYLLGLIETRIGHSYWLSQAEAYLETAIRLAPGEPTAIRAYDLLEEFLVAGYSGSGGTHVPPDIQAKLDLLRRVAEGA